MSNDQWLCYIDHHLLIVHLRLFVSNGLGICKSVLAVILLHTRSQVTRPPFNSPTTLCHKSMKLCPRGVKGNCFWRYMVLHVGAFGLGIFDENFPFKLLFSMRMRKHPNTWVDPGDAPQWDPILSFSPKSASDIGAPPQRKIMDPPLQLFVFWFHWNCVFYQEKY